MPNDLATAASGCGNDRNAHRKSLHQADRHSFALAGQHRHIADREQRISVVSPSNIDYSFGVNQLLVFAGPEAGRVQWIFASDEQQSKPGVRTGGFEKTPADGVEALEVCEPADKGHNEVGLGKTKPCAK